MKPSELEYMIEHLIRNVKNTSDDTERDEKRKQLEFLSNRYYKLTGKYYVVKSAREKLLR